MNRNSAPGLGQWITVSLMVVVSMFLLYKLYQYAGTRTTCLLYTSPSPRDRTRSRMPSSA